ncbi:transcriptional regulator [Psychrobacter sp. F1192]|uniref:Transcriptional regulator n=1 Tax=Psychrobacter coccoides TaxID=2818440 RepID=A0ABS3NKL3_9GAMM|nr:transcriptional regulator [Psychrobacter coccoides]MBO1529635.1 transcriptional regulator [Psychrobacter coccoides]
MTIEQLGQAGRLLYGDQWQSALARALDVDNRTVRRWASGESAIKDAIRDEITELLTTNQKEIGEYLADNA